jgi:hypothetical protein
MTFICKKCKKAFRKDAREFEDRCAPTFSTHKSCPNFNVCLATSTARIAITTSFSTPRHQRLHCKSRERMCGWTPGCSRTTVFEARNRELYSMSGTPRTVWDEKHIWRNGEMGWQRLLLVHRRIRIGEWTGRTQVPHLCRAEPITTPEMQYNGRPVRLASYRSQKVYIIQTPLLFVCRDISPYCLL